jgi:hypothetical protein
MEEENKEIRVEEKPNTKFNFLAYIGIGTFVLIGIVIAIGYIQGDETTELTTEKTYDPITKTVTISSTEGTKEDIADVQLKSDLAVQVGTGYQKVFQYEINSYQDYESFIKETEIYNLNKNNLKENKQIDLKYQTFEDIDDVKYNCEYEKDGQVKGGSCKQEVIGKKQIEVWKDLSSMDMKIEKLTIAGFTNVNQGDYYEWIPNFAGIKVEEWATWSGNISARMEYYFKLDEGSNGTYTDAVGTYNGIGVGSPVVGATGRINTAVDFEAGDSGDGIYIGANGGDATGQPMSINLWMIAESFSNYGTFIGGGSTGYSFVLNPGATGELSFGRDGLDEVVGTTRLNAGQLYMITITYNASGVTFYINGTPTNIAGYSTTFVDKDYAIGRARGGANYYDGILDEVAFWNRSITPAEITLLFNSGNGCQVGNEGCFTPPVVYSANCNFTGYVKDAGGSAINAAKIVIINQTDNKAYYNTTSASNGLWYINVTNNNATIPTNNLYNVVSYYNNSLVGIAKPFINSTCP